MRRSSWRSMVSVYHLKSKRRQVQGYLRWLEPTVWRSSQRRLFSPTNNDTSSHQEALETQRKFQQVAARRRSFNQCRGHQKTGRDQSGGSFSRTPCSGVRKRRTHCFIPRYTTTARTTHSWYCQEEKTTSPQEELAVTTSPPVSAPVSVQSAIAPQFGTIVRLDGDKISCRDLVSLAPNSADVVFIVLELYQDESHFQVLLAQKCQLSDGVAVRPLANFRLTCPAFAVHTFQDTKLSFVPVKESSPRSSTRSHPLAVPVPAATPWPTAPTSFKFGGTTLQPSFAARSTEECLPRQLASSSSKWAQMISATILNYLG